MNYDSAYLWEQGSSETKSQVSLVLQQAIVCKKSILFACVCEGKNEGEVGVMESGYFTEGLVEWFHKEFLKFCERKRADEEVEKMLHREVKRMQGEVRTYAEKKGLEPNLDYWGILLWDNHFWLFAKGECKGYLINKRFNKKNVRELSIYGENRQVFYLQGRIQRKLGIMLCTSGFISHMEREELAEVLSMEGEVSEERMEKRLQELWQENVNRGEKLAAGVIYLRTW